MLISCILVRQPGGKPTLPDYSLGWKNRLRPAQTFPDHPEMVLDYPDWFWTALKWFRTTLEWRRKGQVKFPDWFQIAGSGLVPDYPDWFGACSGLEVARVTMLSPQMYLDVSPNGSGLHIWYLRGLGQP